MGPIFSKMLLCAFVCHILVSLLVAWTPATWDSDMLVHVVCEI